MFLFLLSNLFRICDSRNAPGPVYPAQETKTDYESLKRCSVSKCLFNRVTKFVYLRLSRFVKAKEKVLGVCSRAIEQALGETNGERVIAKKA